MSVLGASRACYANRRPSLDSPCALASRALLPMPYQAGAVLRPSEGEQLTQASLTAQDAVDV